MAEPAARPGDGSESTLLDGTRLPKDDARFEALGAVDELSAALGVVRAELSLSGNAAEANGIREVQRVLVRLGAEIATAPGSALLERIERPTEADLAALESLERSFAGRAPRPTGFVLPGATPLEARVHVARTVCRRAERRVVSCLRSGLPHLALAHRYLNRLSGCLFWLALCHGLDG